MLYIKDDLLSAQKGIIIHGCNASGGFGSGVAGAIRRKWPHVYEQFRYMPTGVESCGKFQLVKINTNLYVGNLITQLFFGNDGKKYANLEWINLSLRSCLKSVSEMDIPKIVNLPKIGSGLGGLDWDSEVEPLIQCIEADFRNFDFNLFYI